MPTSSGLAPLPRGAEPPKVQATSGMTETARDSTPEEPGGAELELAAARRAARQHLPSPAEVAKAGDPRHRPPTSAAQGAPGDAVTALLTACLGATDCPDCHTTGPSLPGR